MAKIWAGVNTTSSVSRGRECRVCSWSTCHVLQLRLNSAGDYCLVNQCAGYLSSVGFPSAMWVVPFCCFSLFPKIPLFRRKSNPDANHVVGFGRALGDSHWNLMTSQKIPGISRKLDVRRCCMRLHCKGEGSPTSESRLERREARRAKLPVAPDRRRLSRPTRPRLARGRA